MKRFLLRLTALGAGLALLAVIVAWSGLVPIAASSGHWKITSWVLHSVMRQSVKTHAMGIEPPPLDDPALIRAGAGHFQIGCAKCHGSPLAPPDPVSKSMTPHPPELAPRIDDWRPRELFWIVKHGVKYTGMPAWPAQSRDDEVWAMTAFLLQLPGMDAERYRQLAFGGRPVQPGTHRPLSLCMRCHGEQGRGGPVAGADGFPRLDIQTPDYLFAALQSYARRERASGMMQMAVAGLDERELAGLADHYGRRAAAGGEARGGTGADNALGRRLAEEGIPGEKLPACNGCHGSQARKDYPRLAGQHERYLVAQLKLFSGKAARGGTRFTPLMQSFAHRLTMEQIAAVADYYAGGMVPPADGKTDTN